MSNQKQKNAEAVSREYLPISPISGCVEGGTLPSLADPFLTLAWRPSDASPSKARSSYAGVAVKSKRICPLQQSRDFLESPIRSAALPA